MPLSLIGAYGLIFVLGLGLVLRPGVLLASLIFKPTFLAVIVLLGVAALAAFPPAEARNLPVLASGALAAGVGALAGLKLRRWTRGGP